MADGWEEQVEPRRPVLPFSSYVTGQERSSLLGPDFSAVSYADDS
jgi:hypothetical protein